MQVKTIGLVILAFAFAFAFAFASMPSYADEPLAKEELNPPPAEGAIQADQIPPLGDKGKVDQSKTNGTTEKNLRY